MNLQNFRACGGPNTIRKPSLQRRICKIFAPATGQIPLENLFTRVDLQKKCACGGPNTIRKPSLQGWICKNFAPAAGQIPLETLFTMVDLQNFRACGGPNTIWKPSLQGRICKNFAPAAGQKTLFARTIFIFFAPAARSDPVWCNSDFYMTSENLTPQTSKPPHPLVNSWSEKR